KVRAEGTNHCFTRAWPADEEVICRVIGTARAKPIDQVADERIDGHQTFGLEFAEWDKNGELARAGRTQAVEGEVKAFAEAHAGVSLQQQKVAGQIVPAFELVLDEVVLFRSERAGKFALLALDVIEFDQMRESWKTLGPGEVFQQPAQANNGNRPGVLGQRRHTHF